MANDGTVKLGVEFDSDDVKKEFEGLKSEAREVERSLKEVNKALKLDPGNTELKKMKWSIWMMEHAGEG